jgi:hypothetical protein
MSDDPKRKENGQFKKGDGRWKKGQSGNPKGKPVGSRDKLSANYYDSAFRAWQKHGDAAFDRMAAIDPAGFCKLYNTMFPRDLVMWVLSLNINANLELKGQSFAQQWELARRYIGAALPPPNETIDAEDAEYLEIEKEEAALAWEREKEEDDD